ncbi:MAG: VanZ family protein [Acidobacteriaceae bacterium]|nr:VanZ family protein [Acidobacteriaceae bacterium]
MTVFSKRPSNLESRTGVRWLLYAWLPAIIMVIAIITESTHTFSAANTDGMFRPVWEAIFGKVDNLRWQEIHHYIRKTGHFTGYGLLCITSLRGWLLTFARSLRHMAIGAWRARSALMAICTTVFVASSDELHQYFMPDRTGTIVDVGLDTFGGLCFLGLSALLFWRRGSRSSN